MTWGKHLFGGDYLLVREVARPVIVTFTLTKEYSLNVIWEQEAACSVVVKLLDLGPQGRSFDPWWGHDKICSAVGPLSNALNPTLQGGMSPAYSNQM